MFVSKRRFILKTCGTTTPLQCLETCLKLAAGVAGYVEIEELFYSRKNFKRPEMQVAPHRDFEEEVAHLDSYFEAGRAYCLGAVNKDCWYLYTMSRRGGQLAGAADVDSTTTDSGPDKRTPKRIDALIGGSGIGCGQAAGKAHLTMLDKEDQMRSSESSDDSCSDSDGTMSDGEREQEQDEQKQQQQQVEIRSAASEDEEEVLAYNPDPDQTIEILMTELDPKVMEIFTKDSCMTGQEATVKSGIDQILPGMKIDDYLFDPCGYSMNGIARNVSIRGGR